MKPTVYATASLSCFCARSIMCKGSLLPLFKEDFFERDNVFRAAEIMGSFAELKCLFSHKSGPDEFWGTRSVKKGS